MDEQLRQQILDDIDDIVAQKELEAIASILERNGATIPQPFSNEALEEMKRALNMYIKE